MGTVQQQAERDGTRLPLASSKSSANAAEQPSSASAFAA
jgi:hypothetical protein